MAELVDAPDLGSGVNDVGVQVPSGAPNIAKYRRCFAIFFMFDGT